MIPRDQIARMFHKQLTQEPDLQPTSLLLQLVQVQPIPVVSDGLVKLPLYSSEVFRNLRNDSNSFLSTSSLINAFLVLRQIEFVVNSRRGGETLEFSLDCRDCCLFVPGIYLERWGTPISFDKKLETLPRTTDLVKKV